MRREGREVVEVSDIDAEVIKDLDADGAPATEYGVY